MNFVKYSMYTKLFLIMLSTFVSVQIFQLSAQEIIISESDIPIVYITGFDCSDNSPIDCSAILEDDKINTAIKIIDNEDGSINNLNGPFAFDGYLGIEYRGNPNNTKRSFSVETRNIEGDNDNVKLFGFPKENDWIFYGPYLDKSLIRNALVYNLVREMGWYAPHTKFFNLVKDKADFDFYINPGELTTVVKPVYEGLYVLLEKIKQGDKRVDIAKLGPTETVLPQPDDNRDKTGGYIVLVDDKGISNGLDGWASSTGEWNYLFEYPKIDLENADGLQDVQVNYIKSRFNAFEAVMQNDQFNDPITGYPAHINVASFIDYIIVQEFTKNVDGYRKSSYFYKDKNSSGDSLIYAGPVWDFNISLGNTIDFEGEETTGFQYDFNTKFNDIYPVPFYWAKLLADPEFSRKLKCRYTQLRGTVLKDENVFGKIDSMATLLKQAADLNFEKWPILNTALPANAPNGFDNYQQAIDQIKNWLTARFAFLDEKWKGDFFDVKSSASAAVCPGEEVELSVEAAGEVTGFYDWAIGDSIIASQIGTSLVIENADPSIIYTVTGYNESCADTALVKVNVSSVSGGGNKSICPGEIDTLEARGAVKYEWSPAYGFINESDIFVQRPLVSPEVDTVYQVILTTTTGCEIIDSVKVNVKKAVPLTVNESITTCQGNGVQLSAMPDTLKAYSWMATPEDESLDTIKSKTAAPFVQPLITTAYTVNVTGENNCTASATVNVEVLTATTILEDPTFFPQSKVQLCNNETLSFSIAGLTNYSIQPQSGYTIKNDSIIINPTVDRTYTFTIELLDGCLFEEQLEITIVKAPIINLGKDQFLCEGKSIVLNENLILENATATWQPAIGLNDATILSPIAQPTKTTSYTIKLEENGCVATDEITVNVIPNNFANVSKDITICKGGQAQLAATGGVNYAWSPTNSLNNSSVISPIASPNVTTVYEVAVEDENGCIDKAKVKVKIANQLQVKLADKFTICKDGNGVKLNAAGAFSYNWEPATGLSATNIANPTANPANTTTYTLTATDGACTVTETTTVNAIDQSLTAYAGEDVAICTGDTIQLKATAGIGYVWTPKESLNNNIIDSPLAAPKATTTYSVITANIYGCTDFDEVTVFVNEGDKDLIISPSQKICAGNETQLAITFKEGYQYKWSPVSGLNNANIFNPTSSPTTTTNYEVEVTNLEACRSVYSITVDVVSLVAVSAGDDVIICKNENIELNATGSESYMWNVADSLSDLTIPNPIANPQISTNYVVQLQKNGCSKSDTVYVEVVDLTAFTETEKITVCEGSSITLSAAGGDSYNWNSDDVNFIQPNLQHQTVTPTQTLTSYQVEISSGNCVAQKQIELLLGPSATYNLNPTFEVCNSGTVTLNLEGENLSNISWQPSDGLNDANLQQPEATINEAITYTTTFTADSSCVAQATTTANITNEMNISTNAETFTICLGATQTLRASSNLNAGVNFEWTLNGEFFAARNEIYVKPKITTTYTVTGNLNNCSASKDVTVNVIAFSEDAGIDDNVEVCYGDDIQLNAKGGDNYLWQPAALLSDSLAANPVATNITEPTRFSVEMKIFGCILKDSIIISPVECLVEFIPNTFSPNNDGVNDTWFIPEITRFDTNDLSVYNRWGQLVYNVINYQNDWEGTFNDKPLPAATYYYVLKVTDDSEVIRGTITIIR